MMWLAIILGALLASIGLLYVVGLLTPEKHTASRTARFRQNPQAIFGAITDWRVFPTWRAELKEVRPRQGEAGRESWIEVSRHGEMPMEVIESDPPRRLVGRIADPQRKLPFGGTWTYVIESTPDGGTLTITEDGEVYSPMFRAMARYIFGYTATMEKYLKSLSRKFGEEVELVK